MPDPDKVKDACEACFDANKSDCSGFARAVGARIGVPLSGLATLDPVPRLPIVVVRSMISPFEENASIRKKAKTQPINIDRLEIIHHQPQSDSA